MHYGVKKGRKRAGNSNRPKMQLVRFDHLAQNGVEIKFLNTLTSSGEGGEAVAAQVQAAQGS